MLIRQKEHNPLFRLAAILRKEETLTSLDLTIVVGFAFSMLSSQVNPLLSYLCLKTILIFILLRLLINSEIKIPEKRILVLIFLFLIIQFVSSVVSHDPVQSFTTVKIRAVYYAAFFAPIIFIDSFKKLKLILAAFIVFTSLVSAIEICLFISDILSRQFQPSQYRIGYFGHPITEAEIKMAVVMLIVSLLIIKKEFPLSTAWLLILSVPVFVSFLLTNSRGPFVALMIGLLIIGAFKKRSLMIGILLFASAYLLLFPPSINGRLSTLADPYSRSNIARAYMIETGLKISADNPVFGVGSIGLRDIYSRYKKISITGEGDQLHNNILQILVTIGIPGLAAWVLLMAAVFRRQIIIYRTTKRDETFNMLALCSAVFMLMFQVCGLIDWNFADYAFVIVFWFMTAIAFLAERFYNESAATGSAVK